MTAMVLLAISTALSILFIPIATRLAPYMGMVDLPDPRKVHAKPIPRIGGIGITLGALIPIVFFLPFGPLMQSFVIGAVTLFLFGMWDDAKQLSHWVKFVGQFFAAGLVVYYGDLWVERFPFLDGRLLPEYIGKPFTVFAIVGVINAINHSDGLDGLAGGESLLCLIVVGFLAYIADDQLAVYLSCAIAGGILGFLRFNTHPAQIFMGDAGSQFLGFSLAFLVVYLTQVAHPALSPALPLLLIGLPIADINAVFYLRITGGMNWFRASRNHVHHRLLDLGFNHYETVIAIYSAQALLVGSAVLARYESDLVVSFIFFVVIAAVFILLTAAERRKLNVNRDEAPSGLSRFFDLKAIDPMIGRFATAAVTWITSLIVIAGAWVVAEVPVEFGWVGSVLFVLCAGSLAIQSRSFGWMIRRIGVYVATLFVVYLSINYPSSNLVLSHFFSTPVFIALAIVLALAVRLTEEQTFKTTPTDYLVVFGIITIALFGREQFAARETSLLVIHSVIMLYASELAFREESGRFNVLTFSTLIALGTVGFRGVYPA